MKMGDRFIRLKSWITNSNPSLICRSSEAWAGLPRERNDNRATFYDAGAQLEGVWRRQLQSLPFLWEILCAQLANSVLPSLLLSLATEINHARDDLTGPAEIIEKYNFSRFCSNSSKGSSGGVRKGQIHQVKWTQQRCFVTVCWCL